MNYDLKQILMHILTIIDYQEDKDAYAAQFIHLCEQQALFEVLKTLPEPKQHGLAQKMRRVTTQQRVNEMLFEFITPEVYSQVLSSVSQKVFSDLLQVLLQDMSADQKMKLQSYTQLLASQLQHIKSSDQTSKL